MAEEKARSGGTPDDVLQRTQGQDFLLKCLRKAKFSADLLQDTADACEINDLNALVLGSGLLSVSEASEKLFLMQDEASTVVSVCRKECLRAGVNFGDGATLTPEELAEPDEEEATIAPAAEPAAPAPPAPAPAAEQAPAEVKEAKEAKEAPGAAKQAPTPATQASKPQRRSSEATPAPSSAAAATPAPSTSARAASPAAAAAKTAKAAPAATPPPATGAATTSGEHHHPDPNFLIKPPVAAAASTPAASSTPAAATPQSARSHLPRPGSAAAPAASATPRDRPAAKPATRASPSTMTPQPAAAAHEAASGSTPAMNGKHTPAGAASSGKPPRPTSAPLTARASHNGPLPKERPPSAATPPSSSQPLPSYAKPTAAHKARMSKDEADAASTSAAPVTFASTSKPLRRFLYVPPRTASVSEEKKEPKKPVFDNIRSSLLRPTAAFLAWSQGKGKGNGKEADLRSSQTLTQSEVAGPTSRNVRPSVSAKVSTPRGEPSASASTSSPSAAAAAAAAAAGGSAQKPTTTPEPFRLASMGRHQKAQEELARKIEEKARQESNVPKFKATPLPSSIPKPSPASPKPVTATQTDS